MVAARVLGRFRRDRLSSASHSWADAFHRELVGRELPEATARVMVHDLGTTPSRGQIGLWLARSEAHVAREVRRIGTRPSATDEEFAAMAYREVLEREADSGGKAHLVGMLRAGASREDGLCWLLRSDECVNRVVADLYRLPDLRAAHPQRYRTLTADDGTVVPCVEVRTPADYDWLERAILDNGYYDKPGIWGLGVDEDKRTMAAALSVFAPRRGLELGCSSGAVLRSLLDLGIACEGIELSESAVAAADPEVRGRIRVGDLLHTDLPEGCDLIWGLDIFEHLNPNQLPRFLDRVGHALAPGGFVFANIPAYGDDEVFGEVFRPFLDEWRDAVDEGRPFSLLHVDEDGYPMHGHLVWAGSTWWVDRFVEAGLRREPAIERALHARHDGFWRGNVPARAAFFVFSKDADAAAVTAVVERASASG